MKDRQKNQKETQQKQNEIKLCSTDREKGNKGEREKKMIEKEKREFSKINTKKEEPYEHHTLFDIAHRRSDQIINRFFLFVLSSLSLHRSNITNYRFIIEYMHLIV